MKNELKIKLASLMLAFGAVTPSLHAQLANTFYADGSDGVLIVSNSMTINLANAVTGNWTNNNSANMGKGIYDPTQWAVVFKYSSVVISNGAVLTFANNPTFAPVVWLVGSNSTAGNVTINGELNLDGQNATSDSVNLTAPGPGGFRGGGGPTYGNGTGFGPGGSAPGGNPGLYNGTYGNPQILPLVGGSGGGGNGNNGSGGGGAILIAATGNITVNYYIHATGGSAIGGYNHGSGGAIRLVANQILGSGSITALGGNYFGPQGGPGRIRMEYSQSASSTLFLNPSLPAVPVDVPPKIFPDTNASTVTILSIAGQNPPPNFSAPMTSSGNEDITLLTTNIVTIQVRTTNFPTNNGATVNVYIKPRNAAQTVLTATAPVSGDTNAAIWQVSTVLNYQINQGHTVIQARAFR